MLSVLKWVMDDDCALKYVFETAVYMKSEDVEIYFFKIMCTTWTQELENR